MPLLYSYISPSTDPEKLWAIKRRVAKSLRDANDDERGLAETADMSEDTDNLIENLNKISNQTTNITNAFLNEISKEKRPTDIINLPDFNFGTIDTFLKQLEKIDINKMNASNIEKLTEAKNTLSAFIDTLMANVEDFKERTDNMPVATLGRPAEEADEEETKEETGAEETKGETPSKKKRKPKPANQLSSIRRRELNNFFKFYNDLLSTLKFALNQIELKLLNYRQTTAVLKDDGIEYTNSLIDTPPDPIFRGGCMCDLPFEYRPQYQNRMYY